MHPARILLVYGTSYGHTERIARHMATMLQLGGAVVDVRSGDRHDDRIDPRQYDAVMIGASVIFGRHQPYIERFILSHRAWLRSVPSAFFSVSGAAGGTDPSERAEAQRQVDRFLVHAGWRPTRVATIAGEVAYTRYSWPLRMMMKLISARVGRPTDTSRDHEMTDWPRVERFATEFLDHVVRVIDGQWERQPATVSSG